MLYPIELRLLLEHVNRSSFVRGVKSEFFSERRSVSSVSTCMKPDALLPFAIAATVGFLALGVRGGQKEVDFSKIHGRVQFVEEFADYDVKVVENSPDLRVQIVQNLPDGCRTVAGGGFLSGLQNPAGRLASGFHNSIRQQPSRSIEIAVTRSEALLPDRDERQTRRE